MRQLENKSLATKSKEVIDLKATDISLKAQIQRTKWAGYAVIGLFLVGGLGWAATAPLAAGAVANGIISPDGSRRIVQHLEGGIIEAIKVRDGDLVRAGDPLVELQQTQAAAMFDLLTEQARTLEAKRARLNAELMDRDRVDYPESLTSLPLAERQDAIDSQNAVFEKGRAAFHAQLSILDDKRRQFNEQAKALGEQVTSAEAQLVLLKEEMAAKQSLVAKALLAKSEYLRLERTQAALAGDRGMYLSQIAEVQQKLSEIDTQAVSLRAERANKISADMEEVRTQYSDLSEKLNSSRDILDRTVIVAPVTGKIANLRFKTAGGVISPGEQILDIVPTDEQLLIDARISPNDIDVVSPGLPAIIHLTAYSSRGLPRIDGIVRTVSADRITDEATGQSYFLARIEVSKAELAELSDEVHLMPGMPAEVMIVTRERTALAYLTEPFESAFRRAFRET